MKNISKFSLIIFLLLMVSTVNAQISVKNVLDDLPSTSSAFIDFSKIYYNSGNNDSKGMIIPSVNLGTFVFQYDPNNSTEYPTFFDGMVVYNNATSATTVVTGDNPSTSVPVVPGFYYFSNPNGEANGSLTAGVWTPIGGAGNGIKSKEVFVTTPVVYNEAKLNLGTTVIGSDEVVTFLGAKIYEAGKLIMTADSDYVTNTNVLTTGNGYMFQLLKANTQYKVVVEYK